MSLAEVGVILLDCVHKTPPAQPSGFPYIAIPQMKNGELDPADARHVSPSDFHEWTLKALPIRHDVVLSRRCNPGATAYVRGDFKFALGQNLVLLRSNNTLVCPEFLRWLVRSPDWWKQIQKFLNVGAVFDSLRCADIPNFQLPIPPLDEQSAIASILGSLDDKIDLNRRMNETLEAMARAIFKDWFVDFGPTRAKMEGRAPYLAREIWDLFPDRLNEEGKPEGWEERPLDTIACFLNGLALQKYPGNGIDDLPAVKIAELRTGITPKSDRVSKDLPVQYIVKDGDLLFSWSGSLTHLIWTGGTGALNQHLFKVTSENYPNWFVYYWIGEHLNQFQSIAASKATTMGHIQRAHLTAAKVLVPSLKILKKADLQIGPVFYKKFKNDLESRTLAQTRDLLLPKLMSGEIRVKNAEKTVENIL
jgi:type I restriction enzyme S subunit